MTARRGMLVDAIRYALSAARLATPQRLPLPTPCPGWDLRALLRHAGDSMDVLSAALATGFAGAETVPAAGDGGCRGELSPVADLSQRAVTLLCACALAGCGERRVAVGDRELTTSLVTMAGAVEIAVHGWDISVTCGGGPIPAALARDLLPVAALLAPPGGRAGLFASPVDVAERASPGDRLVAFLGRQPRPPGPAAR